jgi:hypothetical protein
MEGQNFSNSWVDIKLWSNIVLPWVISCCMVFIYPLFVRVVISYLWFGLSQILNCFSTRRAFEIWIPGLSFFTYFVYTTVFVQNANYQWTLMHHHHHHRWLYSPWKDFSRLTQEVSWSTYFRHLVRPFERVISRRKGLYLHRKSQHTNTRTNIRALSGIRTHCLSVQAIKAYASDRAATGTDTRAL